MAGCTWQQSSNKQTSLRSAVLASDCLLGSRGPPLVLSLGISFSWRLSSPLPFFLPDPRPPSCSLSSLSRVFLSVPWSTPTRDAPPKAL